MRLDRLKTGLHGVSGEISGRGIGCVWRMGALRTVDVGQQCRELFGCPCPGVALARHDAGEFAPPFALCAVLDDFGEGADQRGLAVWLDEPACVPLLMIAAGPSERVATAGSPDAIPSTST